MSKQKDEDTYESFGFQGDFPYNFTKARNNLLPGFLGVVNLPFLENLPSRQHINLFEDEGIEKAHVYET